MSGSVHFGSAEIAGLDTNGRSAWVGIAGLDIGGRECKSEL